MKNDKTLFIKFIVGLLLAMLMGNVNLYAQKEIKGKVFNESGREIPNIVIKLKNLEISTISDAGGNFKIWLPEEISAIEFSNHDDYRVKEVRFISESNIHLVIERSSIDYLLELSLEELSNISVTVAGKTEEKVAEIPASVIIISRKDIETYGYTTVSELLQHITGLYLIDGYRSYMGAVGVRGLWADDEHNDNSNYAILINNIYQHTSKLAVPLQAIDRVEVIRGPMSVIYGSGSMYGAINIVTQESDENLVSVSYGDNNSYHNFARITGKNSNFKYTLNIGFDKTDGFNVKYKDLMGQTGFSEFQTMERDIYSQTIADDFSSENHFAKELRYVNFYGSFNGVYVSATHVSDAFGQFFLYPAFETGNNTRNSTTDFTIGYQNKIVQSVSLNAKTSYSKKTSEIDYDFFVPMFYGNLYEHFNISETVLDLNFTPSDKLKIVGGVKYDAVFNYANITDVADSQDPMITNSSESTDFRDGKFGTFTQINYKPVTDLKLIGGVRLEKASAYTRNFVYNGASRDSTRPTQTETFNFKDSDWLVIPRLAAVYSLSEKHIFKLLYGEATQFHYYGFDPKKQRTFEFDYLFSQKFYSIGLNVFRSNLENVLNIEFVYDYETSTYDNLYTNSGNRTTHGAELNFITQPMANLKIEVGGVYQNTTNEANKDVTVAYSPNLLGQAKAMYRIKNYSLGVTGYYVDELESMWIMADSVSGEPAHRLGAGSDSYFITGANLRIDNIYKGLFASLRVSNWFDVQIRYPTVQSTSPLRKGTFGHPRVFTATLGWKF